MSKRTALDIINDVFTRPSKQRPGAQKVRGTVVLMKKDALDFTDYTASVLDRLYEFLGNKVSFQLVSSTAVAAEGAEDDDDDSESRQLIMPWLICTLCCGKEGGQKGKMGKEAYLEEYVTTITSLTAGESKFNIDFDWDESQGTPGAFIVKNHHSSEFYLKSLTLNDVPGKGRIHFVCNSWVYPASSYTYDRIFFANNTYLPGSTPEALKRYREEELIHLRGDDMTEELEKHDRVYGYAVYNDLSDPDKGESHVRPILGGSEEHPYPRRGRTNRPPTKKDPRSESRLPLLDLDIYVPRDERFGHLKMSDFLAYSLKSLERAFLPMLNVMFNKTPFEFDSFEEVFHLYEGKITLPHVPAIEEIVEKIPLEMIRILVRKDDKYSMRLPLPQIVEGDRLGWRTDEEFAREMLAGLNPIMISLLREFPPKSKLDPSIYGDQNSSINAAHIEGNLEGFTVSKALKENRLFILDHHDSLMPYLNRINTINKIYATRTILFLKDNGSLKPLVIELSLPNPDGEQHGTKSRVFTPAEGGVDESIWQLAKAYVGVNDSGIHQLISHWMRTHAVMEPFIIATHRQLSAMHPIHKLLEPHYRDTMNINALARQTLINAGGILETTVFPGKYAMEMSSEVYKDWKLTDQGLPADLLKRGMAVEDNSSPYKIRLLIKDYPYGVDGLAVWGAIERWVASYCSIYYTNDVTVKDDTELQAWWKEVREVGHGDKKDETWWPKMQTVSELTKTCTTIIWVASAMHAALNFGQYPYGGFMANRPTISRRFMPEAGSKEFKELKENPDRVFLKTITSQFQTILGLSLIEVLSTHTTDEVYLGQRDTPEWTSDAKALAAFKNFSEELVEIERRITEMNLDKNLENRNGPGNVPYTLLFPNTSDFSGTGGITGKGVPNSISI